MSKPILVIICNNKELAKAIFSNGNSDKEFYHKMVCFDATQKKQIQYDISFAKDLTDSDIEERILFHQKSFLI